MLGVPEGLRVGLVLGDCVGVAVVGMLEGDTVVGEIVGSCDGSTWTTTCPLKRDPKTVGLRVPRSSV